MSWPCQSARKVSKADFVLLIHPCSDPQTRWRQDSSVLTVPILLPILLPANPSSQALCPSLPKLPLLRSPRKATLLEINAQSHNSQSAAFYTRNLSFTFNWTFSWLSSYILWFYSESFFFSPAFNFAVLRAQSWNLFCSHHFKQGLYANDAES